MTTSRPHERSSTQSCQALPDRIPGPFYYKRIQTVGRSFGYTGPIDGVPGANTYKAEHRIAGYAVNRAL